MTDSVAFFPLHSYFACIQPETNKASSVLPAKTPSWKVIISSFRAAMQPKQGDSDVTLILKHSREIIVSRNELSASSDFFSTLLNSNMRENREGIVRLEHITEACMRDVLEFMRSGSVELTASKNAEELIEAAEYLLLPRLKTFAENVLVKKLTPSNCMSIYYFAKQYRCQELTFKSRKFILSNFAAVTESQDFLNLNSQQMEEWICSDDIMVSTEDVIFKAIVQWVEHSENERKGKFKQLFRHVRLAYMSLEYLQNDVLANGLVLENSRCMKLANDAVEGNYPPYSPRNWSNAHLVVLTHTGTWCYGPDKDKWFKLTSAELNCDHGHMCSFQGKLYHFPRRSISCLPVMFDPSSNDCWTLFRDPTVAYCYNRGKNLTGMASVRGQLFSIDHWQSFPGTTRCSLEMSKYNFITDTWSDIPCFGLQMKAFSDCTVVASMNNFLYLLGGRETSKTTSFVSRVDTITRAWKRIAGMKNPRFGACGTAAHGKIFVAGGFQSLQSLFYPSGDICLRSCEVYNEETDEWQLIASLNYPCVFSSMVYLKGNAVCSGKWSRFSTYSGKL